MRRLLRVFAVLNVHKPVGITSHDVVSAVRRVFGLKRVGHAGTLDPMADGVLPVFLGPAARLIEYVDSDKAYRLRVVFGLESDTLDCEGEVHASASAQQAQAAVSEAPLQAALLAMTGVIEQRIPAYSAKRVDGKKLYQWAREGRPIDDRVKTVDLKSLSLHALTLGDDGRPQAVIDVTCGSGAFMRAIARDLGESLGCGAVLAALTRTRHGRFLLPDSVTLAALRESASPCDFLRDPLPYLALPQWELPDALAATRLLQGMPLDADALPAPLRALKDKDLCALTFEHRLIAVARWRDRKLRPEKAFAGSP
ncbi:MAG: tRNA pseudouridine(55) synthase TruB [Vampirovibrionales bacterium]|nr:tRNA pseudouridine(55) synthase TruB [Vampirovibrionales bacterium]